jgi:hypothetical protein
MFSINYYWGVAMHSPFGDLYELFNECNFHHCARTMKSCVHALVFAMSVQNFAFIFTATSVAMHDEFLLTFWMFTDLMEVFNKIIEILLFVVDFNFHNFFIALLFLAHFDPPFLCKY